MKKYNVLIVDDESLARQVIKKYLEDREDMEICAECSDGFECLKAMTLYKVDIIFLDIQMPRITGFELLEVLQEKPQIIFTTAFDQYAIKAFEMNAVDYLLKPFSKARFTEALNKCTSAINSKSFNEGIAEKLTENAVLLPFDRVVVRMGAKVIVIPLATILYIESSENYVKIHTANGIFLKEKTMKFYEENLPGNSFIRVHRCFIANISAIQSIEPYTKDSYIAVMSNGSKIKVSQDGYSRFRKQYS